MEEIIFLKKRNNYIKKKEYQKNIKKTTARLKN